MQTNERRTYVVIAITALMMVAEIVGGIAFGSMALLADGIHMASHTVALAITAFAYAYARRHADDPRFSFGTGKVNAVGGYTGSILLGLFALLMAWESIERLLNPVEIEFDQALVVAVVGLLVNAASALVLGAHPHGHEESHAHGDSHQHDHNLRAAYLHVLADAVTSLAAIIALVVGKFFGASWVDPLMGIAGSVLVTKWAFGLMKQSLSVLLDRQAPQLVARIEAALAQSGHIEVSDLHVWSIAPGRYGAIVSVVATEAGTADSVRSMLAGYPDLAHVTVEVHTPA